MKLENLVKLSEKVKEFQRNPHRLFRPNRKQAEVIENHASRDHKITLLVAGNGIGKTVLGINMCLGAICPGDNKFFDYAYFRRWHGPKRIRIISNPLQVQDDGRIQQVIDEYIPKDMIVEEKKGRRGYRHLIKLKGGWTIQILSNELDSNEYAGDELGLIWFDEPFPQSIFGENLARTRRGGRILITMTPVAERGAEMSELEWIKSSMVEQSKYDCWWTQGGFEDNCREHGGGYLAHADLEAAIRGCPDDEYRARAFGEFTSLGGLVYPDWKEFNKNIIIPSREITASDECSIFMSLDPHAHKPFVMLWIAAFPDEHIEIIDEWPDNEQPPYADARTSEYTLSDYVELILRKEKKWLPKKPVYRWIDKHYGNQVVLREKTKTSVKNEIARISKGKLIFIDSPGGTQPWREAMPVIASALKPSKITNLATLQCQCHCRNLDYAMLHHMLDARTGRSADKHGLYTKPTELHKCFPNCLEYLMLANPRYIEPKRRRKGIDGWYRDMRSRLR